MSGESVEQLQHDLERRRQALDGTLNAIAHRLSFQDIVSNPLEYVQHSALGKYGIHLKDAVSRNPIPVTLLGISLAWLMMGGERASARAGEQLGESVRARAERAGAGLESGAETVREKAEGAAENARAKTAETAARVRAGSEAMAQQGQAGMAQLRRASEDYGKKLQEHPLALGFLGLAVGATMAALLPETQAEHRTLGETRDRLAGQARAKGERLMKGTEAAAEAGAAAASEEAQRQSGMGAP